VTGLIPTPRDSPTRAAMMQVAEQALAQYKLEIAVDNAIGQFKSNPSNNTLYTLIIVISQLPRDTCGMIADAIFANLRGGYRRVPWASDPLDPLRKGHFHMATKAFLTPPGTASFLNLEKPRIMPGIVNAEPRYSMSLIFDKAAQASPEFRTLQDACAEAARDFFKGKMPPNMRSCFRDGAEKQGQYEGYKAGDIFIQPWSKNKPGVVNRARQEVIDYTEFHAGWTARAFVRPFAYDQAGNKGIGLFLDVVQFLKPGKRLDGRLNATEAFPQDKYSQDEEDEEV